MDERRVLDTLLRLMRRLADRDPNAFRRFVAQVREQDRAVEKIPTK